MEQRYISQPLQESNVVTGAEGRHWEDYLTPEQRLDAIAEIFVTIALRLIREQDEQPTTNL
ncbi:MAG: hypothetical protein JOZ57_15715 [Abitibacteriaceae bacterium]|nr:hypothetical protein [Abditibacteriaceae bacterium]